MGFSDMLEITKLSVRSLDLDHLDLHWEIGVIAGPQAESEPHEIFDYDMYVFRSESALGPYGQISNGLRDTYSFRDIRVSLLHKFRQYFYKIKVVHRPTGEWREFGPASSYEPEPDIIAAEVVRQEDMLFREFIGRRCWAYNPRTFGPRCTCYDVVLGRKTKANHAPCFGTGWLGGYLAPMEVWVQIDPSPKVVSSTSLQEQMNNNTTARMISFPPINPKAILIESENKRWGVVTVTTTQRLRANLRQELQLHEIPKGDIEYSLPVNVDLATLEPAAERNFSNPQNQSADEDYSDIFAVYGKPRGALR